ncbi:hypothetical protein V1511DRAFT_500550 [Dipodascopsis uninucleata]
MSNGDKYSWSSPIWRSGGKNISSNSKAMSSKVMTRIASSQMKLSDYRHLSRRSQLIELKRAQREASYRLKNAWESIIEKYGRDFSKESDVVDIFTGEVIEDNGHLNSIGSRQIHRNIWGQDPGSDSEGDYETHFIDIEGDDETDELTSICASTYSHLSSSPTTNRESASARVHKPPVVRSRPKYSSPSASSICSSLTFNNCTGVDHEYNASPKSRQFKTTALTTFGSDTKNSTKQKYNDEVIGITESQRSSSLDALANISGGFNDEAVHSDEIFRSSETDTIDRCNFSIARSSTCIEKNDVRFTNRAEKNFWKIPVADDPFYDEIWNDRHPEGSPPHTLFYSYGNEDNEDCRNGEDQYSDIDCMSYFENEIPPDNDVTNNAYLHEKNCIDSNDRHAFTSPVLLSSKHKRLERTVHYDCSTASLAAYDAYDNMTKFRRKSVGSISVKHSFNANVTSKTPKKLLNKSSRKAKSKIASGLLEIMAEGEQDELSSCDLSWVESRLQSSLSQSSECLSYTPSVKVQESSTPLRYSQNHLESKSTKCDKMDQQLHSKKSQQHTTQDENSCSYCSRRFCLTCY